MQKEIWKDIPDYEGMYQVSNFGRVKSIRYNKQRILKLKNSRGYKSIQLKHKGSFFYVHRLVAISFIPNPKNKPQVNHIDGVRSNNNIDNLEWCTQSENQKHAYKTGLQKVSYHKRANGENQHLSKLTEKEVLEIREKHSGRNKSYLAKCYGVSAATVGNIISKKTWKHI